MKAGFKLLLFIVIFFNCVFVQNIEASMILNGDFETGDFSGWTVTKASIGSDLTIQNDNAYSGIYAAWFGATYNHGYSDAISQDVNTIPATYYELSFYLDQMLDKKMTNEFAVSWNGTNILSLFDAVYDGPYVHYTFSLLATGTASTIAFQGLNNGDYYYLDDVTLNAAARDAAPVIPTPEPSSVILLGIGLAGILAFSWTNSRFSS